MRKTIAPSQNLAWHSLYRNLSFVKCSFLLRVNRPPNAPTSDILFFQFLTTQKESGASCLCSFVLLGCRIPHKKQTDSDTRAVGIYVTPLKRAWGYTSLRTLTGRCIIYLPAVSTSAMSLFWVIEFPTFNSTKNVALANTSQYVVAPFCCHSAPSIRIRHGASLREQRYWKNGKYISSWRNFFTFDAKFPLERSKCWLFLWIFE